MSARVVWEVRQRSLVDPLITREIGLFEDGHMADNAIFALYRKTWSIVVKPDFMGSEWFPADMRDELTLKGFDAWWADDSSSVGAVFFKIPHALYNQVPDMDENLSFVLESYPPPSTRLVL